MRAKAKYAVIHRHREEYPICRMCKFFGVSRSGYYACVRNLNRPDPNQAIIDQIAQQQKQCKNTYGYRRMQLWLDKNGCHKNAKTILRLMKKHGFLSEIRRRRQWKQLGQQLHKFMLSAQYGAVQSGSPCLAFFVRNKEYNKNTGADRRFSNIFFKSLS